MYVYKTLFFFIIPVVLVSCDSSFTDLGDGFEVGWVHTAENVNVYYDNVGLIEEGNVINLKWNDQYMLVKTNKDLFLIDKSKVINDHGASIDAVFPIKLSAIQEMQFENEINFND